MTSTDRRHEANRRLFEAWQHPAGTSVLVKRANGETLRTRTTGCAFWSNGGAYVTVEGIPGNTAMRRISIAKVKVPAARIRAKQAPTKTERMLGRPVAVPRVRFRRHRTPLSLLRAFFKPMGVRPEDIQEAPAMLADTKCFGMWAFAETLASPPVIHYWHEKDANPLHLAMLLGHEVGHISGKKLRSRRNDWREELRADEYGAAAYLALRQVLGRR